MRNTILSALALALAFGATLCLRAQDAVRNYPQNQVSVSSPPYCSDVSGKTTISIVAPGMTQVEVKCWKQGDGFGSDSTIGSVDLDPDGKGTIDFPADDYPHGPITVRLYGTNPATKAHDNCYLQLYNKGGVSWNEGIPKQDPPGAAGMTLLFADDFKGPMSISSADPKATYYDHKPPNGSQDFSSIPFTGSEAANSPFHQEDGYLRIRASAKAHSAGLISSLKNDATGVAAAVPSYFECRFIAPCADGTWPAFWLLTDYMTDRVAGKGDVPCDELDIIEAVGGEGPSHPNGDGDPKNSDLYQLTPHRWGQGDAGNKEADAAYHAMNNPIKMSRYGVPSNWFNTFHIYGCRITDTDTTYYLDNIEIGHHKTFPISAKTPAFFLVNLATGGGWPVDLSRYDGTVDMYVDYIRVYTGDTANSRTVPSP